ncbi:uncharacterized protein LOC119395817 [Rhipicephalus sanguineus]|uniref:uncharacterized protein LOC119395817 n=1 Tax=Rhipicephalus sanguineus TaxID=34632 RepID=UPI0020C30380|nr:uncharacterized protein LOC119395817 [Rhipicephalus sanguineus]
MKLKMPHPDTIRRLCSSCDINPVKEQQETSFLSYAKRIVSTLKEHEKTVTLMLDEVHLQSFFDYKAGFVTGAAANSSTAAKTAHVFMIQSLLSSNKDVVHILPVAHIDAKALHDFLRKLILDLEASGFRIIAVISDNNSINRKAMSFFAKPASVSIVYQHPADSSRPLFFVVDPVHILKCIRNNWLNQRNIGKCMYFPEPKSNEAEPKILTASFKVLCELHEAEKHELLKLAPTLTLKALNPSNMERQDVKLALKVFNSSTVAALSTATFQHAKETSEYIDTILTWWNIVNVKTPRKGQRLRDHLQGPIVSSLCPQLEFLQKAVEWLDHWESLRHDNGRLTRETHAAFSHTTHALHELAIYCLEELHFEYVLLGKFQTDCLEDRFGKYRQLSGANYHVSIRQIYESENKLRLQKVLDLPDLDMLPAPSANTWRTGVPSAHGQFDVAVTDSDIQKKASRLPAVTYVAGYCAHAALKKLACGFCRENLVMQDVDLDDAENALITKMSRGGLKFPRAVVVNAVLFTEIILDKLRAPEYSARFLSLPMQKDTVVSLVFSALADYEDLDVCDSGHSAQEVMEHVVSAAANTLLNNLCRTENDKLRNAKNERKLKTLKT